MDGDGSHTENDTDKVDSSSNDGQFYIHEESFEDHMASVSDLPPGANVAALPPPMAPVDSLPLPTHRNHPFTGIRIISNGCHGTIQGAILSSATAGTGSWTFINQRDDLKFEQLTKTQVENGMSLASQLRLQMAGFDLNQFVNPHYRMSTKHTEEGWSSDDRHSMLGYRVARNFTNKPSPCYGTIVAVRVVPLRTMDIDEGYYFFNLHDDGDTEELSMQDLKTSLEMWMWYARQTNFKN